MRRSVLLLCTLLLCTGCSEPPQKEIDRAQGAIDAARAAGAEQYATIEFSAASTALQQAHESVKAGEYRIALSRALDAYERAQGAARQAADGKARVRSEAEAAINTSSTALQQLQARVKASEAARMPEQDLKPARQTLADVTAALQKARAALDNGAYVEARDAVTDVSARVTAEIRRLNQVAAAKGTRRRR